VEYIRNCVDFASQLGAGLVYVCSITKDTRPHEESLELLGVSLKSCADYAERAGVVIALEPFPTGELPSAREAGDLIEKVESNNLGLLLDTGHLAISGEPLKETAKEWKDILVHVHFNNNDGLGDLHWPPQRGKLTKGDFRGLLAELESGYHGKVSVELLNPEPVVGTITDSMKYIQSLSPER
jgi:sugar phosphate isomerase/epimerase